MNRTRNRFPICRAIGGHPETSSGEIDGELRLAPTAASCLSGIVCTPAYVDTTMWLAARYCLSDSRPQKRLPRATAQIQSSR
jgi:hypothetical protein